MRLIDADMLLANARTFLENAETDAYYTGSREVKAHWDDAMRLIKEMPTVSRWTPCSERLPQSGSVLCCDHYGEIMIGYPYEDKESNTGFSAEYDDCFMLDCVAWMPLPEPYTEEEDDG